VFVSLPWYPESGVRDSDLLVSGRVGWPTIAATVAQTYRAQPSGTAIVTEDYWQAGALDTFGPGLGLPKVYSPNRGYYYFGTPPDSATRVLFVGSDPSLVVGHFGSVTTLTAIDVPHGFPTLNKGISIYLCEDPAEPWSTLWPRLHTMET
jgi:hypothetical protein